MKKKFLIALLAVMLPVMLVMTGCAGKPVEIKGRSLVFSRAYVRWGTEITQEEKEQCLADEEMDEAEFFEALKADVVAEVGNLTLTFNEDGTCIASSTDEGTHPTTHTYEQSEDLKTITLTSKDSTQMIISFVNGQYQVLLGGDENSVCYYVYFKVV